MNPFTIDLQMLGCLCQPGDDQDKCVRAYVIVAEYRLRGMYEGIPLYVSKCYRGRDAAERDLERLRRVRFGTYLARAVTEEKTEILADLIDRTEVDR